MNPPARSAGVHVADVVARLQRREAGHVSQFGQPHLDGGRIHHVARPPSNPLIAGPYNSPQLPGLLY